MKRVLIAAMLLLAGCSAGGDNVPVENQSANRPDDGYDVRFLFEVDGCKLYSFYDSDRRIYFANCSNGTTRTDLQFNEDCGESCTARIMIETVGVNRP